MAIWFKEFPLRYAQERGRGTLIEHLGIELLEAGEDYLKASMPVNAHTRQPAGMLHGGASVALAETLASWAATYCVDTGRASLRRDRDQRDHVRPMAEGYVYGVARPVSLAKTLQVWEVRISNEQEKLVCISRVTMAVLSVASQY